MNTEIDEFCGRVISAMFDGGSRGLLIVAAVWAALKFSRGVNAATRHGVWFVTLLTVAALPVVAFFGWGKGVEIPAVESEVMNPPPLPKAPTMMIEEFVPAVTEEGAGEVFVPDTISVDAEPVEMPRPAEESGPYLWEVSLPLYVAMVLVAGWIALAFVRLLALGWQLVVLNGITRRALAAPADLKAICGKIGREMRLRRGVKLLFSSEISAPMVVGFFSPRVLIPQEIAGTGKIEPLLRHELAHVARWDDWANLTQQVIKAVFFFHPGVLIASRRLTTEREIACDDHALAALAAPRDYALFLTEFASRMRGRDYAAAPAAWSRGSQLKERIVMILDGKRNASPRVDRARFGIISAASVLLAALAIGAGPRLALAAGESEKKTDVAVETQIAADVETDVLVAIEPPAAPIVSITTAPVAPKPPRAVPALAAISADVAPTAAHLPVSDPRPRAMIIPRRGGDDEMERRLERLERMVESLMGKEKGKGEFGWMGPTPKPGSSMKGKDWDLKFKMDDDEKGRIKEMAKRQGEEAKRMADQVKREVEQAHRQIELAHRDADRARREVERQNEWNKEREQLRTERQGASSHGQDLERERQALERERRSIEKRIESIEKEMQKRGQEGPSKNRDSNSNSSSSSSSNDDSGPAKEKK